MEAASVAWKPLGFEAIGFAEIEKFPSAILKHHFPNTINYGDITKYNEWPIEPGTVDILVGGTPCQSFSVAGLRKGLEDPRGNLALVFLGIVDKLRPKWVVWENVPGILSSNGGKDFGAFLGALGELGYGWSFRVLDAQYFGVPQRRRRVFCVATNTGDPRIAAEVLSIREGLCGYIEESDQKRKGSASGTKKGSRIKSGEICGTICADSHPGTYSGQDVDSGRIIPTAFGRNNRSGPIETTGCLTAHKSFRQDFDTDTFIIDRACFNQGENASYGLQIDNKGLCPTVIHRGPHAVAYRKSKRAQSNKDNETWVDDGRANTLNVFDTGDTRTTHAIVQPTIVQASELRIHGKMTEKDICPTLKANSKQGDTEPLVVQPLAFKVRTEGKYTGQNGGEVKPGSGGSGALWDDSKTYTINTSKDQYIMEPQLAVRRLTPEECEKLQGFEPGWSKISWKGRSPEDCPDGLRYKACGNSMAVPVMAWIGKRIKEVNDAMRKP